MAEIRKRTYRTAGNFTFTAESAGLYRFHVIGKGGNGSTGSGYSGTTGNNGGYGGAGGGYAVHEVTLSEGEQCQISIGSNSKTVLVCKNSTITATDGNVYSAVGKATGGNISNVSGSQGSVGRSGGGGTNGNTLYRTGGGGGTGASSVGKYQAGGGSGGGGGYDSWPGGVTNPPHSSVRAGGAGVSPINTDIKIGGAGGGGGGGGGGTSPAANGAGGIGQPGGVVIEILTNAPTAPPWIEIENAKVVFGLDVNLKWGVSTDIDGDLSGYILERSINSGAWTELYKGSMRAMTDIPANDWQTVQYRVKAYDGESQASGYISTEKYTVIQNSPPNAAGALIIPSEIRGGSTAVLSWGRATDPDDNLVGYVVEQSVDGGAWAEIANTTTLTAEVPIAFGWATVQFRVRAYDAYGALGEYVTSELATIINNRPPVISGEDLDLGAMVSSFAPQTYTVTDEDGDAVRVVENLNGTEKKAFDAVLGDENTLAILPEAWRKILNGKHTFRIIATDAQGAAVTRQITFTKQEGQISFLLTQPLAADAMPERCILSIQGAFPAGSMLMIEVCNNAFDEAPVWGDITNKVLTGQKHYFANTERTAEQWGLGVRVSLNRGTAVGDCYIHSIRGNYA